jgi:tetratricopeptide (TPR) repeat protein
MARRRVRRALLVRKPDPAMSGCEQAASPTGLAMNGGASDMAERAEKSGKKSGVDSAKKWLGVAAAVLSFGSAAYGVLHEQASKRQRENQVTQLLASGRLQEKASDYDHAFESFQKAKKIADADDVFASVIGGLGKRRAEVGGELEKLSELWLRNGQAKDEEGLADIADNAVKVLAPAVDGATGAHKADLLAHLGYAYFLKGRFSEGTADKSTPLYREAVAADPQNPYANAFWGHLIVWNHGSLADAKQHFAVALASGREHEVVRRYQLSALSNEHSDEVEAAWWQLVNEMRKAGEPLAERTTHDMASKYYFASSNEGDRKALFVAVPPAEHAELARFLLGSGAAGSEALSVKVILAESLEAAGKKDEALAAWQDVQTAVQGDATIYNTAVKDALKRLGAGAGPAPKPKPKHR